MNKCKISEFLLSLDSSWERLKASGSKVILYGTGNGADMVLDNFHKLNIKICSVCASSDFVRSRTFRGFPVISLSDALKTYPDATVALGFASSVKEVTDRIINIHKTRSLIIPVVPVFGQEIFNRELVEKNREKIDLAEMLLADEKSKAIYKDILSFQFTGNLEYLLRSESSREEALCSLLKLSNKEDYVDLGAYRGDTLKELFDICSGFSSAICLEPDKKTFLKLSENAKNYDNVTLFPYAVWNQNTTLTFAGTGSRQSNLSETGYEVEARTLDTLAKHQRITYIKADVEGAEKEALEGMKNILLNQKPKLCISAYHRSCDIFNLVIQIHQLNPSYSIHLRHHHYIPHWDTNIYCT